MVWRYPDSLVLQPSTVDFLQCHGVLQKFHDSYYHPSNGIFWFYGDDPPVERLRILDEFLSEFDEKTVASDVTKQPLLTEPTAVQDTYAAGEKDDRVIAFSHHCH